MKTPSKTFTSLRHRNFQLYFGGQLISNAGTWMQIIAQSWLVYQISHSELTLGIISFAAAIPALFISPFGGVVVDRVPKRALLIVTQSASMMLAFILGALAFLGIVQEWHVIALATLLGVVNAFDAPARQAFVVDMVGKEDLPNAIAMNSLMFNSARVIGPAMGGILLALVGAAWCFTVNGLSFLAVIVGLWLMRLPPHQSSSRSESPFQQLASGVRYSLASRELVGLLLMALVFSVFGTSYTTILPAFAEKVLHQGASAYGWITSAIGLGAVTGAILIAQYSQQGRRGRWLSLAISLFPIVLAIFAYVKIYPVTLLLAYLLGIGFMLMFNNMNTLLQTNVDDSFRGRVMGLYTLTIFGLAPFGSLAIGGTAEKIGLGPAILLFAAITLILSQLILWKTPQIRRMS